MKNLKFIQIFMFQIVKMHKEIKLDYVYNEIKSNLKINSEDVNKKAEKEQINNDNESNNKYENNNEINKEKKEIIQDNSIDIIRENKILEEKENNE